jgi:hypothetical protein
MYLFFLFITYKALIAPPFPSSLPPFLPLSPAFIINNSFIIILFFFPETCSYYFPSSYYLLKLVLGA